MRRAVVWTLLAAAAVAVLVVASAGTGRGSRSRADAIARRIGCPVCVGESVADSNAPLAREMRADIARRVRAGQTDEAIVAFYAERYPNKLLTPPDSGLGLLAWGLPVVALVLAVAGLTFAFARWRAEPRLVATSDDEALVGAERQAR